MFSVLDVVTSKDMSWLPRDGNYILADTVERVLEFIAECAAAAAEGSVIGFDTETTGLSFFTDRIVGFSLCPRPGRSCYVPLAHKTGDRNVDFEAVRGPLFELLTTAELVCHNGFFDWARCRQFWSVNINWRHDTMVQASLIDSDRNTGAGRKKLGLDALAKEKLGLDMLEISDLGIIEGEGSYNFALVTTDDAVWYAGADPDVSLRLHLSQYEEIKRLNLETVYRIEMRSAPAPAEMSRNGIHVDKPYLATVDFTDEILRLETEITRATGFSLNLDSQPQLADLLFQKLKLPALDGNSVDEEVLKKLEDRHPCIPLILERKELVKLKGSFIDKVDTAVAEDGRLHLDYNPLGARSGRFSSAGGIGRAGEKIKMNGQTWPKPTEKANIRRALAAEEGRIWVSADFSQIEYRVLATAAGQADLVEALENGFDVHVATASMFLNTPMEDVDDGQRKKGKTLNFAVVYGMSDASLAQRLNLKSVAEATRMRETYFNKLPRVEALIQEKKRFCLDNGFITTQFGRIRWFRGIKQEESRKRDRLLGAAFNTYVQGTAADLNKIALARVWKLVEQGRWPMWLLSTVHDEVNVEVPLSVRPREFLPVFMDAVNIRKGLVPGWMGFPADLSVGPNYGQQTEIPKDLYAAADSWADLIEMAKERAREEKAKRAQTQAAKKESSAAPREEKALLGKPARRARPAIRIGVAKSVNLMDAFKALKETCSRNQGLYHVYVDLGDGNEFMLERVKVNPRPQFIRTVEELGLSVEMFPGKVEGKSFDPATLRLT